ncbi:MAG: HEPN domain-containing protein [Bdellovibrionales bacterium]|nr:HEPN domain-containing protein [Bdellovibrionales bacterium]
MTLEELLRKRRIREQTVNRSDVHALLEKADSDLRTAEKILSESVPWAYTIAYNAVLQASRAFIFSEGYRLEAKEAHKNTFLFLRAVLEQDVLDYVTFFDRVRVKRHQAVYDASADFSETETRNLLSKAEEFIDHLRQRIGK